MFDSLPVDEPTMWRHQLNSFKWKTFKKGSLHTNLYLRNYVLGTKVYIDFNNYTILFLTFIPLIVTFFTFCLFKLGILYIFYIQIDNFYITYWKVCHGQWLPAMPLLSSTLLSYIGDFVYSGLLGNDAYRYLEKWVLRASISSNSFCS